ncbi:hypothetical protein A5638_00735 [Mycolicibacterium fortuitum]|uniref:EspA/EspE family type VII secretion system effector n=1 Tax=Mycolicibacterium fortuitum TaxID=1766 RepID=UPI0007ECC966|nr:EspA/EspE family type VII secretion system effector [Mycolicibacterium fortuitum]OBK00177.1 hypothetical protein A5638_00735 [Mycolicibacterium fortuitum]
MSALDGFYSTWDKARETFGVGTPPDGSQYDGSSQLLRMKGMIDSAAKHDGWQGTGADAYAAANKEHANVYGKLAELDKQMAAEVTNAANIVTTGREQLDATKSWVDSAVDVVPKSVSAEVREKYLVLIAREGIKYVNNTASTAKGDMLKLGFRITDIKNQYESCRTRSWGRDRKRTLRASPTKTATACRMKTMCTSGPNKMFRLHSAATTRQRFHPSCLYRGRRVSKRP